MQKISKDKGITLVSLIVTIIILMILAGVIIATVTGNSGILNKSKFARDTYQNSVNEENNVLSKYENEIDKASIDVASSRDEVTISKDEYNRLVNSNSYSLDEKEIGIWIDGSKIYRKVFDYGARYVTSGRHWYYINLGLSKYNISQIISVKTLNNEYLEELKYLDYNINGDNLGVYLSTDDTIGFRYVILEYTKKTE